MRHTPLIFSFSSILLVLASCGHKGGDLTAIDTAASHLSMGLHTFADCNATLDYFKSEATTAMQIQLEAQKRWMGYCLAVPEAGPTSPAANSGAASAPAAVPNHSTTNNQVASVDEADIFKTFTVGGALYNAYVAQPNWQANSNTLDGTLVISQVYPVANAAVVGEIAVPGMPQAMLVAYPYVVVMTQDDVPAFAPTPQQQAAPDYFGYTNAVKILVYDLNDLTHPTLVRQRFIEGQYLAGRMVGQSVRVVTTNGLTGPTLQWYPDFTGVDACNPTVADQVTIAARYDALIAQNKQIIANTTLADWLPQQSDTLAAGQVGAATALACDQVLRPGDPAGTATTQVTTLSLQSDASIQAPWDDVAVIAEGQTVYASATSLYVATNPYDATFWSTFESLWENARNGNNDTAWVDYPIEQTTVSRFDTTDAQHTSYVASSVVQGSLINQFAMDEQNNLLRVASTTRRLAVIEQSAKANNLVTILDTQGADMPQVGTLTNLEVGEHITAVRFVDPQVFMSTMQETDPFLVVDLSNPAAPTLRGSLPVPGDATYLQSLDANHVLAIGYGTANRYGWLAGVQLSIYDVSQPGSPQLTQNTTLQGDYVYSEALYNHLALTYFTTQVDGQPVNLLAFPVDVYNDGNTCSTFDCYYDGLRVYRVDLAQGFTFLGDVYHNDLANSVSWGYEWVQRSMIMGPTDDGKTYIVSASDLGEKITDLTAFVGQTTGVAPVSTLRY